MTTVRKVSDGSSMNKMEYKSYYCEHCGKFFKTQKDRKEHIKNIHATKQTKLM